MNICKKTTPEEINKLYNFVEDPKFKKINNIFYKSSDKSEVINNNGTNVDITGYVGDNRRFHLLSRNIYKFVKKTDVIDNTIAEGKPDPDTVEYISEIFEKL